MTTPPRPLPSPYLLSGDSGLRFFISHQCISLLERALLLVSVKSNPLSPLLLCLALGDFSELYPQLDSSLPLSPCLPATLYTFLCSGGLE